LNRSCALVEKSGRHPSAVEAAPNYLALTKERPRAHTNDLAAGEPRTTVVPEAHILPIRNLRPFASTVSLDREGFSLVRQDTALTDFYDDDEVNAVYYPEVERALKEAARADRVFIFDHTTRRRVSGAEDGRKSIRQPVARVHVDHAAKSGKQRVRDPVPDEADELLRGRVQIINLWRPICDPLRDSPLQVCDASTVSSDDLVASDLIYRIVSARPIR